MGLFTNYDKVIEKGLALVEQKNYVEALKVFKSIPERKRTEQVYFNMGEIIMRGLHYTDTLSKIFGRAMYEEHLEAEQYLIKSMNMGNKKAMYILGLAYSHGKMNNYKDKNNSKHVYEMTIKYLTPFAEEGKAAAILRLGMAYLYGYNENHFFDIFKFSIPNPGRNYEKAFYYLSKAARQGSTEAYKYLAGLYEYGRGTEKDLNAAIYYYRESFLKTGDPDARKKLNELER